MPELYASLKVARKVQSPMPILSSSSVSTTTNLRRFKTPSRITLSSSKTHQCIIYFTCNYTCFWTDIL